MVEFYLGHGRSLHRDILGLGQKHLKAGQNKSRMQSKHTSKHIDNTIKSHPTTGIKLS